jgi:3-oxoadipate enol-lactonase
MRFAISDGEMEYDTTGPRTGLPIIFVHGFPFSKALWAPQVEALKKEFYVITYDVRGHGDSNVGSGQYTVEHFVDDLIGLLDHLKISRAVMAGLSMGGYIILRAAERNPDRVRGLVLCDTRSEADNNEGKLRRATQARSVKIFGMKAFTEPFLKTVLAEKTFQRSPQVVELVRSIVGKTSPAAVIGTLIALAGRTDTTPSLYNIHVPVLLLVGQYDGLTPSSVAHAMKVKIPQSEMHIIPDAGHLSNLENPAEFNKHLLSFLKKIAS